MSSPIEDENALRGLIGTGGDALVLFYADWCPYCLSFLPVYEKLACGPGCYRVSTDEAAGAEDAFAIDIVPTVIFFRKGKQHARLDGIAGVGLNEKMLLGFMTACGLRKEGKQ